MKDRNISTIQTEKGIHKLFDFFRTNHSHPSDIIDIFLDLLFIRAIYTLNIEDNYVDDTNSWDKIISAENQKNYILNNVISQLLDSNDKNIKFYFDNSYYALENIDEETLKFLLSLINDIELEQLSPHQRYEYIESILDKAMEYFGKSGEYLSFRTPGRLREFMTRILDPQIEDRIADVSCGTGALLLSAYDYIRQQADSLPSNKYYGVDISRQMLRIAIMHSYISGMKTLQVERRDILRDFIGSNNISGYDKVYSNSPFGVKVRPEEMSSGYSVKTRNADPLFLEATISLMADHGTAAVIVVGSVLFDMSPGYKAMRKRLLDEMHIIAVISLPVKLVSTGIPLYLVVFKNEINENKVLFMDLISGIERGTRQHIINERLEQGLSVYRSYVQSDYSMNLNEKNDLFWLVDKNKIRDNGYSLNLNFYKPITEINIPSVDNILDGLKQQLLELVEDINALKKSTESINDFSNKNYIEKKLDDICEMRAGRPLPRNEEAEEGELPWVQIRDITKSGEFIITQTDEAVSYEFARKHNLMIVEANDILLSVRGTIGTVAIAGTRMCIGPNVIMMRITDPQVDPWFLFGWLLREKTTLQNQSHGTISMISISMLRNMKINIPMKNTDTLFVSYRESMKKLQHIEKLSEDSASLIGQIAGSLFKKYFQ